MRIKVTRTLPKIVDPQSPPFTPRQAAYRVVLNPDNRQVEETDLQDRVMEQHPDLIVLVELADEFLQLTHWQADALDDWLLKAASGALKPLQTFTRRLFDDYAAVKAPDDRG